MQWGSKARSLPEDREQLSGTAVHKSGTRDSYPSLPPSNANQSWDTAPSHNNQHTVTHISGRRGAHVQRRSSLRSEAAWAPAAAGGGSVPQAGGRLSLGEPMHAAAAAVRAIAADRAPFDSAPLVEQPPQDQLLRVCRDRSQSCRIRALDSEMTRTSALDLHPAKPRSRSEVTRQNTTHLPGHGSDTSPADSEEVGFVAQRSQPPPLGLGDRQLSVGLDDPPEGGNADAPPSPLQPTMRVAHCRRSSQGGWSAGSTITHSDHNAEADMQPLVLPALGDNFSIGGSSVWSSVFSSHIAGSTGGHETLGTFTRQCSGASAATSGSAARSGHFASTPPPMLTSKTPTSPRPCAVGRDGASSSVHSDSTGNRDGGALIGFIPLGNTRSGQSRLATLGLNALQSLPHGPPFTARGPFVSEAPPTQPSFMPEVSTAEGDLFPIRSSGISSAAERQPTYALCSPRGVSVQDSNGLTDEMVLRQTVTDLSSATVSIESHAVGSH